MKMRLILLTLAALITIAASLNAQDYKTGVGSRGGSSWGLTAKYFIASEKAIELLLQERWKGFHMEGLYEVHAPVFNADKLYWYYGFGGHLGTWNKNSGNPWWNNHDKHTVIGVDGILGIEYNFGQIPFNISLDYKPALNLIGRINFWGDEFGISVRYVWGNR